MDRETLLVVGVLSSVGVVTALLASLLRPQVGLGVGLVGVVTTAVGFGLYRHVSRLHAQQQALEQQVEQQHEKTTSYRRQFEKTQNQLEAVKKEISATQSTDANTDEQSDGSTAQPAATESEGTPDTTQATPSAATQSTPDGAATESPAAETTAPAATRGERSTEHSASSTDSAECASLAAVVEESWEAVETHAVVLEIVDSKRLRTDEKLLKSALQDLIQTVVSRQAADGDAGQVFTSRAIALRAQHRNPQSDVTLQNDGGAVPQRESSGRQVVQVGTTDTGIYVDCTTTLIGQGNTRGKQEARLNAVKKQLHNHGWTLSVSTREGRQRVTLERATSSQQRPA
jgi:hypothetical protein